MEKPEVTMTRKRIPVIQLYPVLIPGHSDKMIIFNILCMLEAQKCTEFGDFKEVITTII